MTRSVRGLAPRRLAHSFWLLALVWTAVLAALIIFVHHVNESTARELLLRQARSSYNKDLVYRRWAAQHGGVYVPADSATPPNPYLSHLPHRDRVLEDGTLLTLINPAYMTRQVHELGAEQYGERGHITSVKPIRPGNKPDPWERAALEGMARDGGEEIIELVDHEGEEHLRYMHAMVTEQACLGCHAQQGYKLGDLRGGISVTIPMSSVESVHGRKMPRIIAGFGLLWLLGLLGIGGGHRALSRQMQSLLASEEELRDKNQLLARMQQAAMLGHYQLDLDEQLWRSSAALDSLLGIEGEDPTDWRSAIEALRLVHPEDRSSALAVLRHPLIATERAIDTTFRIQRASDGETRWVHVIGSRRDPGSRILIGTIRDVHNELIAQREGEQLRNQLEQTQRLESIGRLAGGVAHDFNNMLGVILGNIELMSDELDGQSKLGQQLHEVLEAATRSAALTAQLLAFSRRQHVQPRPIDVNERIGALLKLLRRLLGEQVHLRFREGQAVGCVHMDPTQFDQVMINLVVNARDAMDALGSILIESRVDRMRIEEGDRAGQELDAVCIDIRDNGRGMDEETLTRIFEPFFTTKEMGQGTGLGLATVYGAVRQNEGSVEVSSRPGAGSCFTIKLPRLELEAKQEASELRSLPPTASGAPLILLIEDEEMVLRVVVKILERGGYRVLAARGPREAQAFVAEHGRDLALLISDVVMPGSYGPDLVAGIVQELAGLPVLYMSGHDQRLLSTTAVHHFIAKPFSASELLEQVHAILDPQDSAH